MRLRCPHRLFGIVPVPALNPDARVEFTCPSRWCGKRPGLVVLHTFNLHTGELVDTQTYRSPEGSKTP